MARRDNKRYEGTYTNNKGEQHKVIVKVSTRLSAFVLAMSLLSGCGTVVNRQVASNTDKLSYETTTPDGDLDIIAKIVKENASSHDEIVEETYVVQPGDTLGKISTKFGISVEELCAINGIEDMNKIFVGDKVKIRHAKELSELDKQIACIESYFQDYLFESHLAKQVRFTDDKQSSSLFYKSVLFGNPEGEDPTCIYSIYTKYYLAFHENEDVVGDDDKKTYYSNLKDLASYSESQLNFNGELKNIVPFEEYLGYMTGTMIIDINKTESF